MYKMCIFVINQPQYILQQFNTFYKNGDIMNILTYIGIAIGGLIAVGQRGKRTVRFQSFCH